MFSSPPPPLSLPKTRPSQTHATRPRRRMPSDAMSDDSSTREEDFIMVQLKNVATGDTWDAVVDANGDVEAMSAAIAEQHDLADEKLKLVYRGKVLDDPTDRVSDTGVSDGAVVYLVVGKEDKDKNTSRGIDPSHAKAEDRPLPMLGGMRQSDLRALANSPMMQMLESNPAFMREIMLSSNPRLREEMDRNPQLREALDNPESMRQRIQMLRSPAYLSDVSRNMDHQLTQIQNMPGGNAYLERMAPLLNPDLGSLGGGGSSSASRTQQQQQQQQQQPSVPSNLPSASSLNSNRTPPVVPAAGAPAATAAAAAPASTPAAPLPSAAEPPAASPAAPAAAGQTSVAPSSSSDYSAEVCVISRRLLFFRVLALLRFACFWREGWRGKGGEGRSVVEQSSSKRQRQQNNTNNPDSLLTCATWGSKTPMQTAPLWKQQAETSNQPLTG